MTLETRVCQMEVELGKAKRSIRLLSIALVSVIGAWAMYSIVQPFAMAQSADSPGPKIIRANAFVVESEEGEFLASLGELSPAGGVGLVLDPYSWGHSSLTVGRGGVNLLLSMNTAHFSLGASRGVAEFQVYEGAYVPEMPSITGAPKRAAGEFTKNDRRTPRAALISGFTRGGPATLEFYDKEGKLDRAY